MLASHTTVGSFRRPHVSTKLVAPCSTSAGCRKSRTVIPVAARRTSEVARPMNANISQANQRPRKALLQRALAVPPHKTSSILPEDPRAVEDVLHQLFEVADPTQAALLLECLPLPRWGTAFAAFVNPAKGAFCWSEQQLATTMVLATRLPGKFPANNPEQPLPYLKAAWQVVAAHSGMTDVLTELDDVIADTKLHPTPSAARQARYNLARVLQLVLQQSTAEEGALQLAAVQAVLDPAAFAAVTLELAGAHEVQDQPAVEGEWDQASVWQLGQSGEGAAANSTTPADGLAALPAANRAWGRVEEHSKVPEVVGRLVRDIPAAAPFGGSMDILQDPVRVASQLRSLVNILVNWVNPGRSSCQAVAGHLSTLAAKRDWQASDLAALVTALPTGTSVQLLLAANAAGVDAEGQLLADLRPLLLARLVEQHGVWQVAEQLKQLFEAPARQYHLSDFLGVLSSLSHLEAVQAGGVPLPAVPDQPAAAVAAKVADGSSWYAALVLYVLGDLVATVHRTLPRDPLLYAALEGLTHGQTVDHGLTDSWHHQMARLLCIVEVLCNRQAVQQLVAAVADSFSTGTGSYIKYVSAEGVLVTVEAGQLQLVKLVNQLPAAAEATAGKGSELWQPLAEQLLSKVVQQSAQRLVHREVREAVGIKSSTGGGQRLAQHAAAAEKVLQVAAATGDTSARARHARWAQQSLLRAGGGQRRELHAAAAEKALLLAAATGDMSLRARHARLAQQSLLRAVPPALSQ